MEMLGPTVMNITPKVSSLIESGWQYIWENHRGALLGSIAICSSFKVYRFLQEREFRNEWDNAEKDMVVLHGFPRAKTCPSISNFHLKLETYLRMAGIKYKFDSTHPTGSTGKCPWITINGEDYTDSELIMGFLGKMFNKDFSSHLSEEQKAMARTLRIMTEEHIFWGMEWWRFIKDEQKRVYDILGSSFSFKMQIKLLGHRMGWILWAQGLGRHSDDVIEDMMRKDVEAISLYLGKKPFLMGDTPCEVDCSIFAMVVQFVYALPGSPFEEMVIKEYKNVYEYCRRMKEKFWPDWNENLAK